MEFSLRAMNKLVFLLAAKEGIGKKASMEGTIMLLVPHATTTAARRNFIV